MSLSVSVQLAMTQFQIDRELKLLRGPHIIQATTSDALRTAMLGFPDRRQQCFGKPKLADQLLIDLRNAKQQLKREAALN